MATLTLQQQLDAANAAYNQLLTGASPRVVVDQNGERIEYNAANADRLRDYIERLTAMIANGGVVSSRRPYIPLF